MQLIQSSRVRQASVPAAVLVQYINEQAQIPRHRVESGGREAQIDRWIGMSHTRSFLIKMLKDLELVDPPKMSQGDRDAELRHYAEGGH